MIEVNYVPALREQIKGRQIRGAAVVTVRAHGGQLPRVNPETRQAMGEPQQFLMTEVNGVRSLSPLPKSAWVDDPIEIEVGRVLYR